MKTAGPALSEVSNSSSSPHDRRLGSDATQKLQRNLTVRRNNCRPKTQKGGVLFEDSLFDNSEVCDLEILEFRKQVAELRTQYPASHPSNTGFLTALRINGPMLEQLACDVRVIVSATVSSRVMDPIDFECPASSKVGDLLNFVIAEANGVISVPPKDLVLKFLGMAEYILCEQELESPIGNFQSVFLNCTIGEPTPLVLCHAKDIQRRFERVATDDEAETDSNRRFVRFTDDNTTTVSKKGVAVLMNTFHKECQRLQDDDKKSPQQVVQAVKAISFTLVRIETLTMHQLLSQLTAACESGEVQDITKLINRLKSEVNEMLKIYESAFFQNLSSDGEWVCVCCVCVFEFVCVCVCV